MSPLDSIPDLLLLHKDESGQKVAFSAPGRVITYAELEIRTRRIAANLAGCGVGRGHFVAVILGRCVEAVESVLAITRTGAVGVPLDPRAPPAELARTLEHCGARVAFTDGRHYGKVCTALAALGETAPEARGTIIVVGSPGGDVVNEVVLPVSTMRYQDWAEQEVSISASHLRLDNLGGDEEAFLHYTSGTTGLPKGVLSTQKNWLSSAVSFASAFGLTSEDHFLWPLPLFHCLGHALCIVATLAVGASAHILGPDETPSSSLFTKEAQTATIVVGAPATFHELVVHMQDLASTNRPVLPRLRVCMNAGSSATADLSAQVQKLLDVPILNNYGCTEACGAIAINKPGDAFREDSSGTPVPDMEIRLVGPDGNDVEDGQPGEVWIRGPSLMLRYYKEFKNPFTAEGWFRTGDLARRPEVGADLHLVGRQKELIIQGGENIQPEELEKAMLRCAGVADVVVAGIPHDRLGETAAAFIVRDGRDNGPQHKNTPDLDPTALLAGCRKNLPDYKVPTAFYEIDDVPRTLLGKPRRSALRSNTSRPLTVRSKLSSRESVEALVLAEVLGACNLPDWPDKVEWDTPFTALGVTSLGGVLLRDRLCTLIGLNLPTTLLFNYPSPAAVSAYIYYLLSEAGGSTPFQSSLADTAGNGKAEPIAIISMSCRYPGGVTSPEDLWRVVADGLDVTSEFPNDRGWDLEGLYSPDFNTPGTATTRRGAFLQDMADFDAGLFGMSPREALATDPQQRLLLELTWELMERGHIAPSSLRGSQTGVFVGIMYDDYEDNGLENPELEAHLGLGSSGSVVSGRVSYSFGLHGPSICVHSGCSSSLVATHLAVASLRSGESSLAIAGGVTTMATPRPFILFSKRRGLSADGRCRAYSSEADGTGWSEGIGMLLLERLDDARRNGHQVLGLIRGSAVNSDGASNGLTAPSGPAQKQVIRTALSQAGLSPADVDVLEGHGTATPLGDPIEVEALISAYGNGDDTIRRPPSAPLLLGSIKSNIGHSQAAAGVAGVIKMVQAMRHGVAPASLHVREPSRHIEWRGSGVEVLSKAKSWPVRPEQNESTGIPRPRRSAVSSFGIGGTNSHVILEQAPVEEKHDQKQTLESSEKRAWPFPWLLSGADEAALRGQAQALLADETISTKDPFDIALSLVTTRSALQYRAAIMSPASGGSRQAALTALSQGQSHPDLVKGATKGHTSTVKPRLAYLFSGQGCRLPTIDVLEKLCASFPIFSKAFRAACKELDQHLEHPLYAALQGNSDGDGRTGLLETTEFSQAAIFAFEVAMFRLLESFHIRPDLVAGHSLGEIAAAHAAGALSLAEAAAVITARGKLMATLPANGGMVSIAATEDEVAEDLAQHHQGTNGALATIAVVNSKSSVVVSGTAEGVQAVADRFTASGRKVAILRNVNHAFHSPMMDPILKDLEKALAPVLKRKEKLTTSLISSVTGKRAEAAQLSSGSHWTRHVCEPVRFADTVKELQTEGVSTFIEIGPSAVLFPHVPDALVASSQVNRLLGALCQLWARGVQLDWQAVFEGSGASLVDLPVYAFQRRRYWLDPPKPGAARQLEEPIYPGALEHGILLSATSIPETGKIVCSGYLSLNRQTWLRDHVIGGQIVVPATAFMEMALRASRECNEIQEMMMLEELVFVAPLALSLTENEEFQIQVLIAQPQKNGKRCIDIYSRPSGCTTQHEWTRHATGTLEPHVSPKTNGVDAEDPHRGGGLTVSIPDTYAALADTGNISYGPSFQCVRAITRYPGPVDNEDHKELRASIQPPPRLQGQQYALHPALLDAALHASLLAAPELAGSTIRLPFALRGVQLFAPAGHGPVLAEIHEMDNDHRSVTLRSESTGALVAKISEVVTRVWQPVPAAGDLYCLEWTKSAPVTVTVNGGPSKESPQESDELFRVQGARNGDGVKNNVHNAVVEALCVIQKWSNEKAYTGGRLIMVTEKATKKDDPDVVAAAVWGFVRSAQAEFSGDRIVLADLDGSTKSEEALLSALASKEELIAIREGTIMTPRLSKISLTPSPVSASHSSETNNNSTPTLDVSGTVLVTGGTGGLGSLLSRHILRTREARYLLVVSRSGMNAPAGAQLYEDLRSINTDAVVRIEQCDCADRDQLAALLAGNQARGLPPISAVIHCAGVVHDALLSSQDPERVSRVLRPKVDAAWNLHELVPATVGSFVLFSSYVSIVGNEGQAGYTAGNAFLDALARFRLSQGLPALSLAWGPWLNEEGMAAGNRLAIPNARLTNAQPLTDEQGLQLFEKALQTSKKRAAAVLTPLLLRGPFPLVQSATSTGMTSTAKRTPGQGVASTWCSRLSVCPPESRQEELLGLVRGEIAAVLGYSEDQDVPDKHFTELGFDSFTSVLLSNRLREVTGLRDIPVTLTMDHDTLPMVVQYLAGRLDLASLELETAGPEAEVPMPANEIAKASRQPAGAKSRGKETRTAGPEQEHFDLEMFRGLAALHKRLSQLGQYTAAADVLASASLALPTFNINDSDLASQALPPQRLATGSSDPSHKALPLVFMAPFFPPIIIEGFRGSVYSALAAKMNGERDVWELLHPEGIAVPANLETLAALHVRTIQEQFSGPIILAGYSAGGTVAHVVASKLALETGPEQKVNLAGFVLIDTYLSMTGRGDPDWLNALPAEALTTRAGGLVHMVGDFDLALAKVGGYFRTLRDLDLRPLPAALSTLFIRAQHPSSKMPADANVWRPSWPRATFTVDIPGSHLELLDKRYAPAAAAEIQQWAKEHCDADHAHDTFEGLLAESPQTGFPEGANGHSARVEEVLT